MRLRRSATDVNSEDTVILGEYKKKDRTSIHSVPFYVAIIFFLLLFGLYGIVFWVDSILPTPLTVADEKSNPDSFIMERARHDLKMLTDLGPRIAGGYENEVLAADFLRREINFIMQSAHTNQKIEIDTQIVSGAHYLNYTPEGQILAYNNLQNVIVKLYAQYDSAPSLLVNAHYDSVPTSPGGSDDGINCAVMLEVLRKISRKSKRPFNNIIFLFNGAEETGLQAAHGFITKHKWAPEAKVVVNLEATGAGPKIILFQAGPGASWLMDYYNKVPHPYGQAAGEEIFQSNLIPSDTDFRIFRDYGGLVGLDMAFFKNGYRYHTKFDGFANIKKATYQHVGDNTLSLVENLANAPELENPKTEADKVVYYDIIGLFMISYTRFIGNIINYCMVVLSFLLFFLCLWEFKIGYTKNSLIYLACTFGAIIGGWILAAGFVALLALLLDGVGYAMSWYANPWHIFGLFVTPTVLLSGCLIPFVKYNSLGCNIQSQIQAHAVRIIWSVVLLVGSILNIRTVYVLMILVLFNIAGFLVIYLFRLQRSVRLWQIVYIIFNICPTMFGMYAALTTLGLFVPVSGRMGSDKMVDMYIGLMAVFFTILSTSQYIALVSLIRGFKYFAAFLTAIFVIFFIIVFTPLGFPYSGDPENPAPERFWIIHSRRVFNHPNGTELKRDSGFFLLNMDRNSPSKVTPHVKELSKAKSLEEDCNNYLLCGLPLVHSKMIQIMDRSTWVPAGIPLLPEPTKLEVLSKINISPNVIRYNVSVSGPDRIGVYLSPDYGHKVVHISLMDGVPPEDNIEYYHGRPVYFILYIFGKSRAPLSFSFDVEVPANSTGITTEINVSGIFVHDNLNQKMPQYVKFLGQFPDWADLTVWLASVEALWI